MRTTLDLPDELMRRLKIRAAEEHMNLKDAVALYLERGLRETKRGRIVLGPPVNFGKILTSEDIEAAINNGRE